MCIAVYKPANVIVPFANLEEGFRCNSDGAGLVWVDAGVIQTFKTLSFTDWTTKYNEVRDTLGEVAMLIHFRITSRGKTNLENCHPFMVGENAAVIHNGTITKIKAADLVGDESDTSFLAREVLAKLPGDWMTNPVAIHLIEEWLGSYNKVLVMDNTEHVTIFNESQGYWDSGVWYSNKSYINYTKNYNNHRSTASYGYYDSQKQEYVYGRYDVCDECGKNEKFKDLTCVERKWLCGECAAKATAKIMEEMFGPKQIEHKASEEVKPIVWRPCACCNNLTRKDEMHKVELEFEHDLDEKPEQASIFQYQLLQINDMSPAFAIAWLCSDCAEWALDVGYDNILTIEVLEFEDDINEHEEDDNDETTLAVGI